MRGQLLFLIELQKDDLAAARISSKKKELPEQLAKLNEEFNAFNACVEEEKEKRDAVHRRHRELESRLKSELDLMKRSKDRLLEVKTNKEYQAILKEIETIEKKKSDLEDEIITCLDEIDRAEQALKVKEKKFDSYRQGYEQERKRLEEEIRNLDADLLVVQQKMYTVKKQLREDVLKRYDVIKGLRNGLAVVTAWKEVCNGCHMNIPPQLYNELQKSQDLISCPNCNRIIYWYNQDKND